MAKGKKTGGKDWVKGQVANPRGGGAHDPDKKIIRRLTQVQVAEVGSLILDGNLDELRRIIGDPKEGVPPAADASPLKIWFATVALKGISKGDMHSLSIFLDRVVGKVKDKIELSGQNGGPIEFSNMNDEELDKMIQTLVGEASQHGLKPR